MEYLWLDNLTFVFLINVLGFFRIFEKQGHILVVFVFNTKWIIRQYRWFNSELYKKTSSNDFFSLTAWSNLIKLCRNNPCMNLFQYSYYGYAWFDIYVKGIQVSDSGPFRIVYRRNLYVFFVVFKYKINMYFIYGIGLYTFSFLCFYLRFEYIHLYTMFHIQRTCTHDNLRQYKQDTQ